MSLKVGDIKVVKIDCHWVTVDVHHTVQKIILTCWVSSEVSVAIESEIKTSVFWEKDVHQLVM